MQKSVILKNKRRWRETRDYKELVSDLREMSEWVGPDNFELPITLYDKLVEAADAIEELLGKPNGKVTRNKGGDECCMSNTIEYKGYIGSVEFSEADGIFFGRVLGIPSLISYEGATEKELVDDFHGAVDDYLTFCEEIRRKNDG